MAFFYNAVVVVAISLFAYKCCGSLYRLFFPFFLAAPHNLRTLAGSNWAVVTGCTDGIGKAYAFELARKRFDLILISRSDEKLHAVSNKIKAIAPGIDVRTIVF